MSSNIHSFENELTPSLASPLSLFPFEQGDAGRVVAVLDHPFPGIARAMFGPIVLEETQQLTDSMFRCVAIADDGAVVVSIWMSADQVSSPFNFWSTINGHIALAQQWPVPIPSLTWKPTPDDCFKAWSNPLLWIPQGIEGPVMHPSVKALAGLLARQKLESQALLTSWDLKHIENQALGIARAQISNGVRTLFSALRHGLGEVLVARPRLSISMAQRMIDLAEQHSTAAVDYALQALRTESFGLIHLVTGGVPEREAIAVRDLIFSGRSLPSALMDYGVAKAVHRHTLHKSPQDKVATMSWSDISISGKNWLTAMRLTTFLPPPNKGNWSEFSHLVALIIELDIQSSTAAEDLLKWCIQSDYVNSCDRLSRLLDMAQTFRTAARNWACFSLSFDESIDLALALDKASRRIVISEADLECPVDASDLYTVALGVAHISGIPLLSILQPIFDSHPGVPADFHPMDHLMVIPLNQMALAVAHGVESENCISDPHNVLRYLAEGAALFGVRSDTGVVVGTIALRCDSTEPNQNVQVQELSGTQNNHAEFDLCQLAQHLANACNTPTQLQKWIAHEGACARWSALARYAD
jgi:hypothetical protein